MAENTGILQVTAKSGEGDDKEEATVAYDFGTDLNDMKNKFGEDVVFSLARAQAKIQLQARMRSWMSADPPKDVNAMAAIWKPGMVAERSLDPAAVARNYLANATEEEKKAFLENIKSVLGQA